MLRPLASLVSVVVLGVGSSSLLPEARAFSLLGPFQEWMTKSLSYQDGQAIGGPMLLGEGYRWNVPVVTYAFDASFTNHFGARGVQEVQAAMAILNALPPASTMDLDAFPLNPIRTNPEAMQDGVLDLKSAAMSLVLEQLGLAQPQRYTFTVRQVQTTPEGTNILVINRNFDPRALAPSTAVNGEAFTHSETSYEGASGLRIFDSIELSVDPLAVTRTAVAEGFPFSGNFFTGLSRDDAGGLRYLLNPNRWVVEGLLSDVSPASPGDPAFVTTATRGGVDKITFQRVPPEAVSAGQPPLATFAYQDRYLTNQTVAASAPVRREVRRPDMLFTAEYTGIPMVTRTGTTNWMNNAGLNGGFPGSGGPGVVQSPVRINLNPVRHSILNFSGAYPAPDFAVIMGAGWGSYDDSTNAVVVYPALSSSGGAVGNVTTVVHVLIFKMRSLSQAEGSAVLEFTGPLGAPFQLQTSTDLQTWELALPLQNLGGHFNYGDGPVSGAPQRFFRVVPQP